MWYFAQKHHFGKCQMCYAGQKRTCHYACSKTPLHLQPDPDINPSLPLKQERNLPGEWAAQTSQTASPSKGAPHCPLAVQVGSSLGSWGCAWAWPPWSPYPRTSYMHARPSIARALKGALQPLSVPLQQSAAWQRHGEIVWPYAHVLW
jgi:hypothetical protein